MSYSLSSEDLPPKVATTLDTELKQQLERALCRYFFEACDGSTQSLLMLCRWSICTAPIMTLNIRCSDQEHSQRVLSRREILTKYLSQFSRRAKIRLHPPSGTGEPIDIQVDEHFA